MPWQNQKLIDDILEKIGDKLLVLKDSGIRDFGYREFRADGTSTGFCTARIWGEVTETPDFHKSMSDFYNFELQSLKGSEQKYFIRTGPNLSNSPFLNLLFSQGVWNTFVLYKKNKNFIEGFYFIPEKTDISVIMSNFITFRDSFNYIANLISDDIRKILSFPKYHCYLHELIEPAQIENILIASQKHLLKTHRGASLEGVYFTNRELETMLLLAHGHTMKGIGAQYNISPRTVEKHVEHIKDKLYVNNKSQIISFVNRANLVNLLEGKK